MGDFDFPKFGKCRQSVRFADQFTSWAGCFAFDFRCRVDQTGGITTMHNHPYIQIVYTKAGTYRHFFMDSEFTLTKGSLVIIPPYYPHALDNRNDGVLIGCEFTWDFIMSFSDDNFKDSLINMIFLEPVLVSINKIKPYHYFSEEASVEIEKIFEELCNESQKQDKFSSMLVRANLMRLFSLIAKEYNICDHDRQITNYREALDSAISYINANFSKQLYLEDVCKKAMMNRQTFSYLFRQIMGATFSNYLQYLRVVHAKELLKTTDRTQDDISKSCGFHSLSYFHRTFKKLTGMYPGEYRQNHTLIEE